MTDSTVLYSYVIAYVPNGFTPGAVDHIVHMSGSGRVYLYTEAKATLLKALTDLRSIGYALQAATLMIGADAFVYGASELEVFTTVAPPAPSADQCSEPLTIENVATHKNAIKILGGFASPMVPADAALSLRVSVEDFPEHAVKVLTYPCGLWIALLSTGDYYSTMIQDEFYSEDLPAVEKWLAQRAHWM